MEIVGLLFLYVFYRMVTSEQRKLKQQRKVSERYAKESDATWRKEG